MLPPQDIPSSVFVNDDVDAGWDGGRRGAARRRHPLLGLEQRGRPRRHHRRCRAPRTVEELRAANGSHRVVTVDEAVELIGQYGPLGLQPLCGGLDPEVAWTYLRRVVDEVVPAATPG